MRLQDQSLRHFNAASLKHWVAAVFAPCGVAQVDADMATQVLVRTSLRGIDTHGIARIPAYLEKLKTGVVNPRAQPRSELRQGIYCTSTGTAVWGKSSP